MEEEVNFADEVIPDVPKEEEVPFDPVAEFAHPIGYRIDLLEKKFKSEFVVVHGNTIMLSIGLILLTFAVKKIQARLDTLEGLDGEE